MPKLVRYHGQTVKVADRITVNEKACKLVNVGKGGDSGDFFSLYAHQPTAGKLVAWIRGKIGEMPEPSQKDRELIGILDRKILPVLEGWPAEVLVDIEG